MNTNRHEFLEGNPLPFQFRVLEVEDYSNTQPCDAEIVQHQSTFVVGDSLNYFCIYNDRIEGDQIWNEQANLVAFVEDIERRLLTKQNFSEAKFCDQRILVWLLNQPMA